MNRVFNAKSLALVVIMILVAVAMVYSKKTESRDVLNFDHPLHLEDAGLECSDCHEGIDGLAAGERAMPTHDTCEACHVVDDIDECGMCHVNPDDPVALPPVKGMYEGFAHNVHAKAELNCDQCHGGAEMIDSGNAFPTMNDCQNCHTLELADLDCGICHLGKDPVPADHEMVTWHMDHGLEASAGTSDCASCHTQQSCDECHQGEFLDGSPHPGGWKFQHSSEVSFGGECMTCHESRDECTSCHRAMVPIPHTFGVEFANPVDGGSHKDDAEAFIESCISCHDVGEDDPTCARCHDYK